MAVAFGHPKKLVKGRGARLFLRSRAPRFRPQLAGLHLSVFLKKKTPARLKARDCSHRSAGKIPMNKPPLNASPTPQEVTWR